MISWAFQSPRRHFGLISSDLWVTEPLIHSKGGTRGGAFCLSHFLASSCCGRQCASFPSVGGGKKRNLAMLKIRSLRVLHKIIYFYSIYPWIPDCIIALPDSHYCSRPKPKALWSAWRDMHIWLLTKLVYCWDWRKNFFLRNDYIKVFSFKYHTLLRGGQFLGAN